MKQAEQLTLFAAASHDRASHSVQPGSEEARKMTVTSGRKCSGLYRKSSRLGLLVKMLLESSVWHSNICLLKWKAEPLAEIRTTTYMRRYYHDRKLCSSIGSVKTLKRKTTKFNRYLFRLVASTPSISDTGFGLLPTVTQFDATCGDIKGKEYNGETKHAMTGMAKMWATPAAADCQGSHGGGQGRSLRTDIYNLKKMYATPQARDFRTGQAERWDNPDRSQNLNDQVGGKLSVIFVEYLMGYPEGWTDLDPLETP